MTPLEIHPHCCPSCSATPPTQAQLEVSRRSFLAMGGVLMGGLSYAAFQGAVQAAGNADPVAMPPSRTPLIVKPVFLHDLPQPPGPGEPPRSWRNWGAVQTEEVVNAEVARAKQDLAGLKEQADFPVEFLEFSIVQNIGQMNNHPDMEACDTILLYGAGHGINGIQNFNKDVIIFTRRESGPFYLQHQIGSPRFLRQHTDEEQLPGIRHNDLVVDEVSEVEWRLRALCGLKNTLNSKVVTIGGASAWAQPYGNVPEIAQNRWGLEYHDVNYDEMGELIRAAKADEKVMARAKQRAEDHLKIPGTRLETTMEFFINCFVLDDIFRVLMQKAGTNIITVNSCMGAIIPASQTTACYTLTTLLDDGYLAFCESDFVVIPSGILLGNITGKPVFFCNPTFPDNGHFTVAHCSAPRKMDGKNYDPVRILTHMESDYGAAPWVEAPVGTDITLLMPSFSGTRWNGFKAKVANVPFHQICRTQFNLRYDFPDELLIQNMVGFHCMTCYGDYRKEVAYALRRVGIEWNNLDEVPTKEMYEEVAATGQRQGADPRQPLRLLRRR